MRERLYKPTELDGKVDNRKNCYQRSLRSLAAMDWILHPQGLYGRLLGSLQRRQVVEAMRMPLEHQSARTIVTEQVGLTDCAVSSKAESRNGAAKRRMPQDPPRRPAAYGAIEQARRALARFSAPR
jgi:hypothetical protein